MDFRIFRNENEFYGYFIPRNLLHVYTERDRAGNIIEHGMILHGGGEEGRETSKKIRITFFHLRLRFRVEIEFENLSNAIEFGQFPTVYLLWIIDGRLFHARK